MWSFTLNRRSMHAAAGMSLTDFKMDIWRLHVYGIKSDGAIAGSRVGPTNGASSICQEWITEIAEWPRSAG